MNEQFIADGSGEPSFDARSSPCQRRSADQKMGTWEEQFGYCLRLQRDTRFVRLAYGPARRCAASAAPRRVHQRKSRQTLETIMANIFRLQQTSRWTLEGVGASIRAIARAVAAEHTLALRAATKTASPRQSLAEVRAMYVPSEPHQHGTEPRGQKRRTRGAR
jgi:hypothetical protein